MIRPLILLLALYFLPALAIAQDKPDVQIGLSNEKVEIASNFVGTDIVIFGSIEKGDRKLLEQGGYDIVVALFGPVEEVVVRRKERKFGIWVNGESVRFGDVPSSYSVATTRPLSQIANEDAIKILQLGLDNINVVAEQEGEEVEDLDAFRDSLARLKVNQDLFLERIGGCRILKPHTVQGEACSASPCTDRQAYCTRFPVSKWRVA